MSYAHLTWNERYQSGIFAKAGLNRSSIAHLMSRHKSTIGREITRNRGQRGDRPKQAQVLSKARVRAVENGPRILDSTWAFVEAKLAEAWGPEQISRYLKTNDKPGVSYE